MKRLMLILLAVAALSFAAAASARAEDTATIQCADGTAWVLDLAEMDVATFGDAICDGGYVVLAPDTVSDPASGPAEAPSASAGMAPDPAQYVTEVQCPNGQIWAVASGDDFFCPAA